MYAKLINGVLQYAPKNFKNEEGCLIVNFNQNEELMKEYNYKEVIDNKPDYNRVTHYIVFKDYTEDDTSITINYTVNERISDLRMEDRVLILENELASLTMIAKEETNK